MAQVDSPVLAALCVVAMAKYLHRPCPKCRDYLCVDVLQRATSDGEHLITGYCAVCGYQLKGWRVIPGGKQSATFDGAKKVDVGR